MRRLPHGYTNEVLGDTRTVVKTYQGPDVETRQRREYDWLRRLRGRLPVPPVLAMADGALTLGFVEGAHGQDLIDAGYATEVLAACGRVLGRLHAIEPGAVHGDFGPNNMLLDPVGFEVTALLDWEWAHMGDPVEDIAWCEWIVRMHHPGAVGSLPAFFDAYEGEPPPWPARQAAMLRRCEALRELCERWQPGGPAVAEWTRRTARTASWMP